MPQQLDLAGDLLDELVALLLGRSERSVHAALPRRASTMAGTSASARANAA